MILTEEEHWVPGPGDPPLVSNPNDRGAVALRIAMALYSAVVGPIPPGKTVKPTCDEIRCVRPDHLVLVVSPRTGGTIDYSQSWAVCDNIEEQMRRPFED